MTHEGTETRIDLLCSNGHHRTPRVKDIHGSIRAAERGQDTQRPHLHTASPCERIELCPPDETVRDVGQQLTYVSLDDRRAWDIAVSNRLATSPFASSLYEGKPKLVSNPQRRSQIELIQRDDCQAVRQRPSLTPPTETPRASR